MKTTRICLGCGMPLPPDAPGGLCPQCLLKSQAPTSTGSTTRSARVRPVPIPGATFGGYRIIRLLGQGGMGEVYEAEHIEDGRRVALKVMSHELGSEQDRKRFLREGRLAASVNHPNVVYVFGSEEIDGVPVIAMELVAGGTLRDRLKSERFLPVSEAIEAALQMIDGLESANGSGVLHRDIKPANCFVNPDGGVKVGDFGLSVSTLARGESLLTAKGSVLGTPAYASPEQLRGEELDVRSDIYSVGATLYHLLTGDTPFASQDFVKLITEVLDKNPAAPQALRAEIPAELSRAVLRCLAKDRKDRFQTYAELRDALLPFRIMDIAPATPARRFLAGLIDETIAFGPSMLFTIYWSTDPLGYFVRERTIASVLVWLAFYGAYASYYAIAEGLFGAALGKTLCRLRVVGPDRQLPGIRRALMRVGIYMSTFVMPSLVLLGATVLSDFRLELVRQGESLIEWLWFPLWLALFVTMRRSNGYAALHDILSGTRVIIRPRTEPRPALRLKAAAEIMDPREEILGPYAIRGTLWKSGPERLLSGFDATLNRKVWVHVRPGEALSPARRGLSRPARLRWLTGGVHEGQQWDAYEAISGMPLMRLPREAISWNALRFWLLDLAEEFTAGLNQPKTATTFALDRLWITSSGRAMLLDFSSGEGNKVDEPSRVTDVAQMQSRLQDVIDVTIRGSKPDDGRRFPPEVPIHAHSFLANLRKASFEKPEFIVGNLHSLITKPSEIGRSARAASLVLLPAVLLILTLFIGLIVNFERVRFERAWATQYPGKPSLYTAALLYDWTRELRNEGRATQEDVKLVRVYIVRHFATVITNDAFWTRAEFATIAGDRTSLEEVVADYGSPAADDVEAAERAVPAKMREQERLNRLMPLWVLLGMAVTLVLLFAAVGLLASLLGSALTLSLFGIAVVDRNGRQASRARMLIRWVAVWVPSVILMGGAGAVIALVASLGTPYDEIPANYHTTAKALAFIGTPVALAIWFACLGHAVVNPRRGVQDKLAGTWLVPR